MSTPPAGTTKKRLLSRNDYLAPLPIPTGRKPSDVLNVIWRKNDVFLDVGSYSIGSAVMVMWPMVMLFLGLAYFFEDPDALVLGACIMVIPIFVDPRPLPRSPAPRALQPPTPKSASRATMANTGSSMETVTAAATEQSSVSQAGRATMGLLIIGFENPDPQAREDNKHFHWASTAAAGPRRWRCGSVCVATWRLVGSRTGGCSLTRRQPALLHRLPER
jgi:hypothetical protein